MANEELATIVRTNIERLTETWMRAVRKDVRIDSDAYLTRLQLRDHVPAILEEICELLLADETPDQTNTLEGRVTVFLRLHQGYRGKDLVGEISLLRIVVLDHVAEKCSSDSSKVDLRRFHNGTRIVNLYMDEVLRNAMSAYSESTEPPNGISDPGLTA